MPLHQLKPAPGSRTPKQIVGRGEGSTLGQTAGRGQKGQSARSGDTIMNGFEGGQTPLLRRIPKRGFRHSSKIFYQPINLKDIEKSFEPGSEVSPESLFKKGFLKRIDAPFKILGQGKLTKSLKIFCSKFSKSAEKAVKERGGSFVSPA